MIKSMTKKDDSPRAPIAVALSDDKSSKGALPKLVASGRGVLAEQILELAFQHNIKVREDSDLAEILATLDLDSEIPPEAIVAVAEILVRVYEANKAMGAAQDQTAIGLQNQPEGNKP
jgi:flagellar biosynthesis protein